MKRFVLIIFIFLISFLNITNVASHSVTKTAKTAVPIPFTRFISVEKPTFFTIDARQQSQITPIELIVNRQISEKPLKTLNPLAVNGTLKAGLDALDNKDPTRAQAIRNGMKAHSQDRHILTWAIAQSGLEDIPSSEIAAAISELKSWPGLTRLKTLWEQAIYNESLTDKLVMNAFGKTKPKTIKGTIALTKALLNNGQKKNGRAILLPFWHHKRLNEEIEDEILKQFSSLLSKKDHKKRMDMLLYHYRVRQAKRLSKLAQAQSLYKARAATIRNQENADKLIRIVDKNWHNDPSYLFTKIKRARRKQRFEEVAKLIVKAPKNPELLVNAGKWWVEQRIISRHFYERGKADVAYKIAANHVASRRQDRVEAEFHAGFYALRGLEKPRLAAKHFKNILKISKTPLSVSRAYYWLGRAAQIAGPAQAKDYYAKAAKYPSTYYGQLAGARLNIKGLNVRYPKPSKSDYQDFENREAVQAIKKLEENDHGWRSDSLYRALARELDNPRELAILASMAEKRGSYQLSLKIGKTAYWRGLDVAALAFPLGAIPNNTKLTGSGKALAYSIARQESAFNKAAISSANAQGLLQLLPATAKRVAKTYGIRYSKSHLTTDAGMNATLGAHFLNEQITNFNGSYIMTFIGYNAGPRRVREWIKRFGDPRGKDIEYVIDWVEMIPFSETRNYVQRVMENYQVYKARLGQKSDIVRDLRFGRS